MQSQANFNEHFKTESDVKVFLISVSETATAKHTAFKKILNRELKNRQMTLADFQREIRNCFKLELESVQQYRQCCWYLIDKDKNRLQLTGQTKSRALDVDLSENDHFDNSQVNFNKHFKTESDVKMFLISVSETATHQHNSFITILDKELENRQMTQADFLREMRNCFKLELENAPQGRQHYWYLIDKDKNRLQLTGQTKSQDFYDIKNKVSSNTTKTFGDLYYEIQAKQKSNIKISQILEEDVEPTMTIIDLDNNKNSRKRAFNETTQSASFALYQNHRMPENDFPIEPQTKKLRVDNYSNNATQNQVSNHNNNSSATWQQFYHFSRGNSQFSNNNVSNIPLPIAPLITTTLENNLPQQTEMSFLQFTQSTTQSKPMIHEATSGTIIEDVDLSENDHSDNRYFDFYS